MKEVVVKFKKLSPLAKLPTRGTPGSAGLDLYACLDSVVVVDPMSQMLIPTQLSVEIPHGWEGQVRPRSGLALNSRITVTNSPGTIDSDFRGAMSVILFNLSDKPFVVKHGDRVAQLVISEVPSVVVEEVVALSETDRGSGGFGSTGMQ